MSATILAFPAAKCEAQIRSAVILLNETHGEAANQAWKKLMRQMADELLAQGVSETQMRREVSAFQAAVQQALFSQSSAETLCS